jgi:hypothetical protein
MSCVFYYSRATVAYVNFNHLKFHFDLWLKIYTQTCFLFFLWVYTSTNGLNFSLFELKKKVLNRKSMLRVHTIKKKKRGLFENSKKLNHQPKRRSYGFSFSFLVYTIFV